MAQSKKPYALGILVGRFQTLHAGHEDMIRTAFALCDRVAVFVGSSQESGTQKNPFSYDTRRQLLSRLFPEVEVYPLPDIGVGNNGLWGEYVLEQVQAQAGRLPQLLVSGKEERRVSWFDGVAGLAIAELYIPKTIEISASRMREFFLADDREAWQSYTNPALWDCYELLRTQVLESKDNTQTASL